MFEINETSDFYIEFNSEEEIDLFQKYLDEHEIILRWRVSRKTQIKGMIDYRDNYLHINPRYVLTRANKKYIEPEIKIINFSGICNQINNQQSNKLLSWIERKE